jgi:uncharacterized membrane protein
MPPSDDAAGRHLAVAAECLYLANLTLAPGLAFVPLLWLHFRRDSLPALARCHLRQAISGTLWAGVLLILLNVVILLLGGYHSRYTLITLFLYFFSCHSWLILLGMIGLAKSLAGQPFVYPLIGARCDG